MKIRTDFVTNSSSSSFVAYGIYDEELAEKVEKLLLKYQAYPKDTIGWINVSDNVVTVTRQLYDVDGGGDYYINQLLEDDYDGRNSEQKAEDEEEALTASNIISALEGFFDEEFPNYDVKKLIQNAVYEEGAMCRVYVDQTDGYDAEDFSYYEQTLKANREKNRALEKANTVSSGVCTIYDNVKFAIPTDYFVINDYYSDDNHEDDEDNGLCTIYGHQYFNDDGKELYKNKVEVSFDSLDIDDTVKRKKGISKAEFDVETLSQVRGVKIHNLQKTPFVSILNIPIKFTIIENVLSTYLIQTCIVIQTENDKSLVFTWKANVKGYDDEEHYGNVLEVLKALSVNGTPITTGKLTAKSLKNKIQIDFDNIDSDDEDHEDEYKKSANDYNDDIENDEDDLDDWDGEFHYNGEEFEILNVLLFKYHGHDEHVVVPDTVEKISCDAFENSSTTLKSVVLNEGVKELDDWAFNNCVSLSKIVLPSSLTSIGRGAFDSCASLTSITIPDSVTYIGDYAFSDCNLLTDVRLSNSITELNKTVFRNCKSLKTITIPSTVKVIKEGAFSYCESLESITIPSTVEIIEKEAFVGCDSLTTIYCEVEKRPKGWNKDWNKKKFWAKDKHIVSWAGKIEEKKVVAQTIGDNSEFTVNRGILKKYAGVAEHVVLPDSVTKIGERAFDGCKTIKSIDIPNTIVRIDGAAFRDCTSLQSIKLPDSIEKIEWQTFQGCTSLKSVYIPSTVTNIAEGAFRNCTSLKTVFIPDSVKSTGVDIFEGCKNLTIHVQAESKPRFWLELWNIDNLPVVWGANPSEYESSVHFAKSENHEFEQANHQECVKAALKEQVQSNVPTYHDRRQFTIDDVIHCAIPDGYRSGANDGVNSGWTYTVSENTPDGSNHIDAKPFSFAIASRPANTQPFNEGMLDSMEMMFKLKGLLNPNVQVRRVISDLNCAYLYQTWYDISDPTYNKANGFLLTEVGVYQFHAYHNHGGEVDSQDTAVIDKFIEVLEEWMMKTTCGRTAPLREMYPGMEITRVGDITTLFIPANADSQFDAEQEARKAEDERKTREEEALRKAKEVVSGNSIEEAYRKAQEDAERRKQEVDKRKAQEAEIKQKREEFILSETKLAEEEYQNILSKLSNEYNAKDNELSKQISEKEKELAASEQELGSLSFLAFVRKGQLKDKIQILISTVNTLKNEKAALLKKYDDSKREAETQLNNKLSSLPTRASEKYPMIKK